MKIETLKRPQIFHANAVSDKRITHEQLSDEVLAMVVLGSPRRQCEGQGICMIEGGAVIEGGVSGLPCQRTTAMARRLSGGGLQLTFLKSALCPNARRKHFSNKKFIVPEAAPVIMHHWVDPHNRVLPGQYTIMKCRKYYRIVLDIVNLQA